MLDASNGAIWAQTAAQVLDTSRLETPVPPWREEPGEASGMR
jgi:hypothetical protein